MKKALLVLGILFLFSSTGFAATYTRTVTNCVDDAAITGSLRWAMTGILADTDIVFAITTAEAGYSTGEAYPGLVTQEAAGQSWFRIIINSALPSLDSLNHIAFRGSTQPIGEANNALGPEIEIRANGANYTGRMFGPIQYTPYLTFEGLALNRCEGNGDECIKIHIQSDYPHIYGCYIGTTATGEAAPSKHDEGIDLMCSGARIGGKTVAERNIISNNLTNGVFIYGGGVGAQTYWNNNVVEGNYIGVDRTGTHAVPNAQRGVSIGYGASGNIIGGSTATPGTGAGNVISGNSVNGIYLENIYATGNHIQGNLIGTNKDGDTALANGTGNTNGHGGVAIVSSPGNYIGSTETNTRNIISGNNYSGIYLQGATCSGNKALGNYIGTALNGTDDLPNARGVMIYNQANNNVIGSSESSGRNVISGNSGAGVEIFGDGVAGDPETCSNEVIGNYIGVDKNGTVHLANYHGIFIENKAVLNRIGNGTPAGRNIISGNLVNGVRIIDVGTNYNTVCGNYIGTDVNGTAPLGNSDEGVYIFGADFNQVGGASAGEGNLLSGNTYGMKIEGDSGGGCSNEVCGNLIGTNAAGSGALANTYGVGLSADAQHNKIGSGTAAGANVVSGNSSHGFLVNSAQFNEIRGNLIGTNASGTGAVPNGGNAGIYMYNASNNFIGGLTAGEGNVISGNTSTGITLISSTSTNTNEITGNYIGVAIDGVTPLKNGSSGIMIYPDWGPAANANLQLNQIGPGNVIANNGSGATHHGVAVYGTNASNNMIVMNTMYNNAGLGISLNDGTHPKGNTGIASPEIKTVAVDRAANTIRITGEGAEVGATIEFFGADATGQGMYYRGSGAAGSSGKFDVTVPIEGIGPAEGSPVTATQTDVSGNTSEFSPTCEVTYLPWTRQPDNMIGTLESGSDYIGENIFNTNGSNQTVLRNLAWDQETATFFVKIKAAGNTSDEVKVKGTASHEACDVTYYDAKTAGNDITSQIIGSGWTTSLVSGESKEIRLIIRGAPMVSSNFIALVTSESVNDNSKKDAVMAAVQWEATPPVPTPHTTQEFTETQLGVTGMHITIPSGACTVDVTVTASTVTAPGAPPAGYSVGGQTFNIGSTPVNTFLVPVIVTIPITGPLTFPKVYYWDGTKWSTEGIVVISSTATSLTFTTTHFTIFAPMATLPGNLVRFGPNPYNPNNGSGRFWYVLNANADTTIYLIDLSGSVVFKQTYLAGTNGGLAGENNITYNGNTSWGDQLGQGVYIYKIVQGGTVIGGGKIAVIK